MKSLRTVLFALAIISSVLTTLFCLFSALFQGAPPAEAQNYYLFYEYFAYVYPITVIIALIWSSKKYNRHQEGKAIAILAIPFILLIPVGYSEFRLQGIYTKIEAKVAAENSPSPDDYICAPGKFIRIEATSQEQKIYRFVSGQGKNRSIVWLYPEPSTHQFSDADLKTLQVLNVAGFNLSQCKNQKGDVIPLPNK